MALFKPFSEDPKDRMTGRTMRSIELTGDISGKKILNIGALGGWYENYIMENDEYAQLVGLDLPGTYIKALQKTYENHAKITFVEGSVLDLPFEKNSFDIVAMWEVMEHLPKGSELFSLMEINRVLKKDGKLLLSTPYADIRSRLFDPAWYLGHRHYSEDEVKYLTSEAGFFDFRVEVKGRWFELLTMVLFYVFKHIFKSEIPFKRFFENQRKEEFLGHRR